MLQSVCVGIPDSYRAVCSASLDSAVQRTRRGLSRQTGTVSGAAWPAGDLQAVSLPAPRSIRTHNQHHLYFTIRNHSSSLGDWDVAEYEWSSYSGCSEMSWECVGQHPPLFSREGIYHWCFWYFGSVLVPGVSSLLLGVPSLLFQDYTPEVISFL